MPMFALLPLAASDSTTVVRFAYWGIALIAIILAGYVALTFLRRKFNQEDDAAEGSMISLSSLRAMRDRGELTEAEYQAARDAVSAKIKAAALGDAKPKQ